MFWFFVYESIGKQVFDCTKGFENQELEIFINSRDIVELKMKADDGVFFGGLKGYLYFDVLMSGQSYGTFEPHDSLAGVIASGETVITISNEQKDPVSLSMIFTRNFYPDRENYTNYKHYPIFFLEKKGPFEKDEVIIHDYNESETGIVYILFGFLGFGFLVAFYGIHCDKHKKKVS